MPYEVLDDRLTIDPEKPWLASNGVTYAPGETVDLAETGPLHLIPNIIVDEPLYTVTFEGEGIGALPGFLTVVAGDSVDLKNYEDQVSLVNGKNFNGWSTTGDFFDIIHRSR